jgi:hypothetical protein
MQKDSLLNFVKIYSANGMVKLNGNDTLKISRNQLIANRNTVITTNNASIPYDSIMIKTSYNKTIGKINVFSRPVEIKSLLLVHIQTDSLAPRANFNIHIDKIEKYLNEKSYNQTLIKWNIKTATVTYDSIRNNSQVRNYNNLLRQYANTNPIRLFNYANAIIQLLGINVDDKVGFIIHDSIQDALLIYDGLSSGFGRSEFVIANDSYNAQTIAHELGHCLKLHHPFGTENKMLDEGFQRQSTQFGNTENIMDYDRTRMHTFWLWQWIIMNNNIKYYNR